jgi:putative DNA primase/helicase
MSAEHSPDDDEGFADREPSSPRKRESYRRERWECRIAMVREALIERPIELVTYLRGARPTGRVRRGKVRWGKKGSFELTISGRFRGYYYDFEADEGGDLFAYIMREQGLSFVAAVEWGAHWAGLPSDHEPSAEEILRQKERAAARAEKEAEEAAKDGALEARRTAYARKTWDEARPIDGTLGEKYLYDARKIHLINFPETVRWSVSERAVICAVTDDAGELVAIQKIAVTAEGKKDQRRWPGKGGAKKSIGPVGRGALRFRGAAPEELCLAEGPETGLTIWAATGHETHSLVGGLGGAARHLLDEDGTPKAWARGRRIVLCRDDDPSFSTASLTLKRVVRSLLAAGLDVRVATPFETCREDKSDFNDLAQERGLDAVRARIELAASDRAQPIPKFSRLDKARLRIGRLVAEFFQSTRAWLKCETSWRALFPPVHAIGLDVGGGKTEAALDEAIRLVVELRKAGDKRVVVILVPEHRLSHDIERRARIKLQVADPNMVSRVWLGRAASVRPGSDERMCQAHATVHEAAELLADIGTEICSAKKCEFFEGCQYRLQQGLINVDLWIGSHNLLFNGAPTPIKESGIAAIVVDEGPFRAGLKKPVEIPLDAINAMRLPKKETEEARLELMDARHRLAHALADEPDGYVRREAFAKAPHFDIGRDLARRAKGLEWLRKIMKREESDWRKREGNRTIRTMDAVWDAVADLVGEDGPDVSGLLKLTRDKRGVRVLRVAGRSDVHADWTAPTLLIDALHDPELIRPFWDLVVDKGLIRIAAPFQTVRQAVGKSYSLSHLSPALDGSDKDKKRRARNRRNVRAVVLRLAREAGGRTLVVGNKSVVQTMEFPPHVEVAWFGAIAGRDNWKDVRLIVIVGRPQPNPADVEWMAGALTCRAVQELGKDVGVDGSDAEPADSWYRRGDAFRFKRDGEEISCFLASADQHPDELCERIRWRICVGEIIQAVGRGRGVNRTEATPLDVMILTDVPLPVPVDEFLSDDAVKANPFDLMLAEGGVAFYDGSSAAEAYPSLWRTAEAARMALQRERTERVTQDPNSVTNAYNEYDIGKRYADLPLCPPVRFKRAGSRRHEEMAIYDPRVVSDPRAAIEDMLGELAMFEIVGQERDGKEGADKREGLTRDAEAYLAALRAALDEKGRLVRADGSDSPETYSVDREEVREEFKRCRPVDGKDNKAVAARKKAFERGEKGALAAGLIQFDEVGAKKYVRLTEAMARDPAPATAPVVAPTPIVVSISNAIIVELPPHPDPGPERGPDRKPNGGTGAPATSNTRKAA